MNGRFRGMADRVPEQGRAPEGRPRILFIPKTEDSSTSERTPALLRIFAERYRVLALDAPWDHLLYDPARSRVARLALYIVDKFLLTIRGLFHARQFRATLVFSESVHHAVAGLIIARILNLRCVWDSHGNGKLFYESLKKGSASIRAITALERFLAMRVDALITVSEIDAAAYANMGVPKAKIHVIPVSVNLADVDSAIAAGPPFPRADGIPVLLFFGSYKYAPNREAVEFIDSYLAPSLEQKGVRCEIWIAGRDLPPGEHHPLVRPLGFVPNIYTCIRAADLSIIPIRHGVGALVKVIDSMAAGTPLVLFEFAAAGIPELRHRVDAYVASNDSEFIEFVQQALADRTETRSMSRRARHLVERGRDWPVHFGAFDMILSGNRGELRRGVRAS